MKSPKGSQFGINDRSKGSLVTDRLSSPHTQRNYNRAFTTFSEWCTGLGATPLPAHPEDVARYLESLVARGLKFSTLRTARAAISHAHRQAGYSDPFSSPVPRDTFQRFRQGLAGTEHRAMPLTEEGLEAVRRTACIPRRITGLAPRTEDEHIARARGLVDVALMSVMREAGLRRSEAAELLWGDIEPSADGSAVLVVRRGQAGADTRIDVGSTCVPGLTGYTACRSDGH